MAVLQFFSTARGGLSPQQSSRVCLSLSNEARLEISLILAGEWRPTEEVSQSGESLRTFLSESLLLTTVMVLLVYVGTVIHLFKLHPYRKILDGGDPLWIRLAGLVAPRSDQIIFKVAPCRTITIVRGRIIFK